MTERIALTPRRLVLVGANSFIARHVQEAARRRGMAVLPLPHDADFGEQITPTDLVINFALTADYKRQACGEDLDLDFRTARIAAAAGARVCLLSTRRVYGPSVRWEAPETSYAGGDATWYGRNKAATESRVRLATGDGALVLRLSNVFGFEYETPRPRTTFLGRMLFNLKVNNRILFDMHPDTRRDFIPVTDCCDAIVTAAGGSGVFNLGRGAPVRCGDIADWVMTGYGRGELVVTSNRIEDEFCLDMRKFNCTFGAPACTSLRDVCLDLGTRLRHA